MKELDSEVYKENHNVREKRMDLAIVRRKEVGNHSEYNRDDGEDEEDCKKTHHTNPRT